MKEDETSRNWRSEAGLQENKKKEKVNLETVNHVLMQLRFNYHLVKKYTESIIKPK